MISEAAKEKRREYMRQYRKDNRKRLNAYQRAWYKRPENEGKAKEYTDRYWEKVAEKEKQEA